MQQAAKWNIHFSLAVNSAREVDPKMHRENLWANTPFSFHLEVRVQDNKTKTHSFEIPIQDQCPHHDASVHQGVIASRKKA
jgi:hypothetical protein